MKRLFYLVLLVVIPFWSFSQKKGIEIVPSVGYMFGGSTKYVEGKMKIDDGMDYGISILIPMHTLVDVELNYTRMDSKASFSPSYGYPLLKYEETTAATNYIQVGVMNKFYKKETKATPFTSLSLGATVFSSADYSNVWRFSATLGAGVKVMFSEKVGIILRGRLLMPMNFAGTSIYFGSGGSGFSVNSWVTPLQGDFNAGLVIKFGN